MGRKLKGRVPVPTKLLVPTAADRDRVAANDKAMKEQYKLAYDRRHRARELPPLVPGQFVLVKSDDQQHWTIPGTVVESDAAHRTHLVATPQGAIRRNRKHLQQVPTLPVHLPVQEPEELDHADAPPQAQLPTPTPAQPEALPSPQESQTPESRTSQRVKVKTRRLIAET